MNINIFLPRWHRYVEEATNTNKDNEDETINDETLQDDTRIGRQPTYPSHQLPDLNNMEPMLDNLVALRLDRIQATIKECSNKSTTQYDMHCTEQIRELKKMQHHIQHLSHTYEPNTTGLLNEHPLTKHLTEHDLHTIIEKCCTMPITKHVVPTPRLPTCEVTAFRLSRLIQNGELVCDEIITCYYEVICKVNSGIFYMDTTFLQVLLTEEWSHVARRFHGERRRSNDPHHIGRPRMEGENAIIIPIHYQENHWINVTRREQTPGEVTFFYADNLNCPHTAQYIESTFRNRIRDHRFMPPSAKWTICKQMHYD